MVINFEQELEVRGVDSNLKNMLDIIQSIFDQLHPVNQRRAKLFDMRQGLKADWGTWIASAYEAWREAGMNSLTMEQFMCMWFTYLTDNAYVKDELLKLDTDKLTWKLFRQTGRDAETRGLAKKVVKEAQVNQMTASNGAGKANGASQPRKKIKCYRCNNGHMARDCTADTSKMRCKDCGDSEAFARNPHYTGAGFCPRVKKAMAEQGKYQKPGSGSGRRLRKIDSEEGSTTDAEYTDGEDGGSSDEGYDRARNFTGRAQCRVDLIGPSLSERDVTMMHRKAQASLMFKQEDNLIPTAAEADSGCDFSLM